MSKLAEKLVKEFGESEEFWDGHFSECPDCAIDYDGPIICWRIYGPYHGPRTEKEYKGRKLLNESARNMYKELLEYQLKEPIIFKKF